MILQAKKNHERLQQFQFLILLTKKKHGKFQSHLKKKMTSIVARDTTKIAKKK